MGGGESIPFRASLRFSISLETSTPRGRTVVAFSARVIVGAISASRRRPAVPVVWEEVSLRLGTSLRGRFRRRGRVPILWVVANVGSDAVEVGRFSEDLVVEPRLPVEIGSLEVPPDPLRRVRFEAADYSSQGLG